MATKNFAPATVPPRLSLVDRAAWGRRLEDVCPLSPEQVVALDRALGLIRQEVLRAACKHGPQPFHSEHEGYAIVLEELDEVWDEVRANNTAASVDEMIQVGAMAAHFVVSFAPGLTIGAERRALNAEEGSHRG